MLARSLPAHMRKLILLAIHLLSCILCIVAYGQADIHTLENRLQQASDPEKVQLLNQAAAQQLSTNPDQTIAYSEQAIILARQLLDDEVKISRHKLSMEAEKQVPIVLELEEAIAYNNLGKAYYAKAQYARSIKNFNEALDISEFKKFEVEKKTALENLVIVNETLKAETADGKVKWDKLIKNKLESLRIGKKIDEAAKNLSLQALEKVATIHEKKKNYSSAIHFHLKTLPGYEASGDKQKVAGKLNHVADLYKAMGNYKDALTYYDLAIQARGKIGDTIGVTHSIDSIRSIYKDLNEFNKKLPVVAEVKIPDKAAVPITADKETSYIALSEDYAQKGDYKKSLEYFKLYVTLKEQMMSQEKDRQLEIMQAEFLLKNKSQEISSLQQQRQLQKLALDKKELELTQQKNFRNTLLAGLSLILFISFMLYLQFRIKRKAHQQLQATYQKLETTHKQLQSAQLQLVQAEKMASLGQLTAGIAHEINNPINFVSANIEPLKHDVNDVLEVLHQYEQIIHQKELTTHFDPVQKLKQQLEIDYIRSEIPLLLNGIEEGAMRTKEIVKGLRIFSRLDENDCKLFDIHESLESTLTLLRSQLINRIEVIKQYGEIPHIEGFPGRINQVLMNILNNAIYAIPGKGTIAIKTWLQQQQVHISIQDTGVGMPAEVKNRIFEPFFTTKDVGIGTGLGLAISYGIIEQHHGKILVDSEPGKGTEFTIVLPVKQSVV